MTRLRINYLARRHPDIPREHWVARWRAHWQLAASMPTSGTVRRYLQCEVLWDRDSPTYDGAASAEYVSPAARLTNRADSDYHRTMRADEAVVFDRLVERCSFVAEHTVLHGAGAGPFKLVRYLRRVGPGFDDAWSDAYGDELLLAAPGCSGYARNHRVDPDGAGRGGLDVDGSEELWFDDRAAALAAATSPGLADLDRAVGRDFVVAHQVVTDEVVLKDEPTARAARA